MTKETKEKVAHRIWLLYFDAALFECGLLVAREYRVMKLKIEKGK